MDFPREPSSEPAPAPTTEPSSEPSSATEPGATAAPGAGEAAAASGADAAARPADADGAGSAPNDAASPEEPTPSPGRACPRCGAHAEDDQRWCLECGHELPQKRRSGVRPVVGIATTLTVLVGAAAAAGFTLVQDGKQPPPPPTTVAQTPPPVTTPPPADTTVTPPPSTVPNGGFSTGRLPRAGGGHRNGGARGGAPAAPPTSSAPPATPPANDVPDLSDQVDNSTPNPPPPSDDAPDVDSGDTGNGSVQDDGHSGDRARTTPTRPRFVPTNVALGSVAVVYSAIASDADPGDPGAVTDGSSTTAWKTPVYPDPTTSPETGVYVDLASVDRLTRLVVDTPTPGLTFEVYAAKNGPPASITDAGWTHVATKEDAGATTQIRFEGQSFRYVLVWITRLPAGRDRAAISEMNVFSKQPQ